MNPVEFFDLLEKHYRRFGNEHQGNYSPVSIKQWIE
jgi:hypothetical protein